MNYFTDAEMRCRCCNVNHCTSSLMDALNALRLAIGKPITVTSGYRCRKHNAEVGGEPNSQHCTGNAADVKVEGMTPAEIYRAALKIPAFGGFGVASTFCHLDVRVVSAKWCYGSDGKQCAWDLKLDEVSA